MDLLCHVLQLLDQYLVLCLVFFYVFVYFVGTVHSVSAAPELPIPIVSPGQETEDVCVCV